MTIGIDVSQLAYRNTGVANYLKHLLAEMIDQGKQDHFVLFFSSLRGKLSEEDIPSAQNVTVKKFPFPPAILTFLWNKLHILPIDSLIGSVDIFISSDWIEPPLKKGKKGTILYDLIVYKYPEESHNKTEFKLSNFILSANIVTSQKRKLEWVKKESDIIFCISQATKKDAEDILGIDPRKMKVIYPGA